MQLKKLPVDVSEFRQIRKENYIYVDKTKQIFEITESGKKFFLARPRRFGKSLLLDTFEELFSCQKDLFEGLYIYDKWEWEEKFPVIRIDFSNIDLFNAKVLRAALISRLDEIAGDNGLTLKSPTLMRRFSELIKELYDLYGREIVILIDEYDKPVLDELDAMKETDTSRANKKVLSNFFACFI
jgi:hypothetical protein